MRCAATLAAVFALSGAAWAQVADSTVDSAMLAFAQAAPRPAAAPRTWATYAGAELTVRDAAAVLVIETEDRSDIAVSVVNPGALPDPNVRRSGRRVIIDGNARVQSCRDGGVTVSRHGRVAWEQLPQIQVRLPRDAVVQIGGGVRARIGPAASARYAFAGCADVLFGNVHGALDLALSGAGDVRGGAAGSAEIMLAGAGDITIGDVRNGLTISLVGNGDIRTGEIRGGDVRIVVQGPGDVLLGAGEANDLSIILAGPGDVSFPGRARSLDAFVAGPGDITVGAVSGSVTRRSAGGGEIVIGGR